MANNDNVRIKIVGTIGSAALAKPRTTPKSNVPQYQVNIQNPNFDNNNLQDTRVQNAIAKLKLRIGQPSSEYPNPSIFVGLPEHNKNSTKENHVLFYDYKTKTQQTIDKDPAIGQTVEVYVDTYNTTNELARKYGSRAVRLLYVVFPDISQVQWFEPYDQGLAGFEPLDDQANNGAQATAQQVPQAPQFNGSTPAVDPFTAAQQGGPTTQAMPNAQNAPQNAFTQSQQVQPTKTNPLLGGQTNTNAGPFAGNGQAQADPFATAGQANTQAAPTTPTNTGVQGGQAQTDPFAAAGQTNTQAAPTAPINTGVQGGQAQTDPFAASQTNAQAAPTTPTNTGVQGGQAQADPFAAAGQANAQAAPTTPTNTGVQGGQAQTDPFAGTGDTVDISDEDLPF